MTLSNDNKVAIAFGLLCIVWGTTYLGIEVAVKERIPPFLLSGIRHVVAGIVFLLFCLIRGHKIPDFSTILKLGAIGILMIIGGNALVCWAEQFIPSGLTAVICSLSPMFITLMSLIAFKNFSINWKIIVGLLLGLSGIICIFYKSIGLEFNNNTILGIFLIVLANMSWGLGTIFMKKNQVEVNLFLGVGLQMIIAGSINCMISLGFEDLSFLNEVSSKGWLAVVYLIVIGSLVGYGCYAFVLSKYLPSRVSIHTYVNTVIAVLIGWLLGSDQVDIYVLIGTVLVLGGVLLVNREYSKMAVLASKN